MSVRRVGAEKFGTRVEIKNLNSFRFIEKAVDYEIERQIDVIESGGVISQETRLYDPDKNRTFTMRTKEDADDYRYFSDPDLLPILLRSSDIEKIRSELPELPLKKLDRFKDSLGLPQADCETLTSDRVLAEYFEAVGQTSNNYKSAANWVLSELLRELTLTKYKFKTHQLRHNSLENLSNRLIKIKFREK